MGWTTLYVPPAGAAPPLGWTGWKPPCWMPCATSWNPIRPKSLTAPAGRPKTTRPRRMPCARSWPPSKNKWTGCKIFSSAACTMWTRTFPAPPPKKDGELKPPFPRGGPAHRTSADHIVAQVHKLTSGLEAYAGMDVQGKTACCDRSPVRHLLQRKRVVSNPL